MKKLIMVDGNNLLFRSYYATAYNGNLMKNSKGFPTNAVYGFVNMMNKIINEEKPEYMVVAFDKGKTFRHEMYAAYKDGRSETPDELKVQFPIAKELLTHLGIKYYEIDDYEADDIIGTFSMYCDQDSEYIGTIISSDKDLLQLISSDVDIKLLKQKDFIRYDEKSFMEEFLIHPSKVVDLKSLQGDASDNIPGVAGIGEKTALKLIQDYGDLQGVYENIDKLTPKMQEKLLSDKENALLSYRLATINKNIPMTINMADVIVGEADVNKVRSIYEELEFYSFLKNVTKKNEEMSFIEINDKKDLVIDNDYSFYIELSDTNYHKASILGMGIFLNGVGYYIKKDLITYYLDNDYKKSTYDLKKSYVALKALKFDLKNVVFDTMIAGYLLDYNIKDDIAYLSNALDFSLSFYDEDRKKEFPKLKENAVLKSKFINETKEMLVDKLDKEGMLKLYNEVDFPLAYVLGDMESDGILVDKKVLVDMGEEIKIKIELVTAEIYNFAGEEFNISSPQQLGVILFEKLSLKHGKKTKTGYSTAVDVLNRLVGTHPIIEKIMEYRILVKLHSTYIEGLLNSVMSDSKIHTIYNQTLARTGRLSSIEPNLQNIPIRYEYGRLIRKAFIASKDSVLLSSDYSQIELRILAHVSNVESLIEAFKSNMDIHTKTAMDIFKVDKESVTSNMRRVAKAVNFGIIYGISSFGLSENLDINVNDAKNFIDNYLETYPGIKKYMDATILKAYNDLYVTTLFNRKRIIPELSNKNFMIRSQGERMALNTPIQGTSADLLKMAMIKIHIEFKKRNLKSKMLLQVHDELVFDVVNNELEDVKRLVEDIMENVYQFNVPLKVEISTGLNWYQAK